MSIINWQDFHFIRPWWLLSALAFALAIFYWWKSKQMSNAWRKVVDKHLLSFLLSRQASKQSMPLKSAVLAALIATIALAGPTFQKLPQPAVEKQQARVILLDLSFSMFAEDIKPSRVKRAVHKSLDILGKTQEGSVGLVVYAGDAFTISPLTSDAHTVKALVPSLSPAIMPILGSDAPKAFEHTIELFNNTQVSHGHILWITDGIEASEIDDIAYLLNKYQHKVSILAVGTAEGAPIPLPSGDGFLKEESGAIVLPQLDVERLQLMANEIGARITTLSADDSDIDYLLDQNMFATNNSYTQLLEQQGFDVWQDLGPYLTLLLLPFVLIAFRRGLVFCLAFVLLLPSQSSQALSWNDLWKTPDQQAIQAYQQQDYQKASKLFDDPLWKGNSLYQQGKFEESLNEFSKLDTATAHYNKGNALAQLGQFDQAIQAYEQALSKDPNHADAEFNKQLVEQLKQQQQQQQNQQQDDSNNQQDDSNDPQSQQQSQDSQQDKAQDNQQQSDSQSQQQQSNSQQNENQQAQQDQQSQQEGEQDQEQEQQQSNQADDAKDSEQQAAAAEMQQSDDDKEFEQTLTQWLRKVPDDPARLLREKMRYEYQQRGHKNKQKKKIW